MSDLRDRIGFHASHEQFTPRALRDAVKRADEAGFLHAMCSDHFAPFSEAQGQSGFAWSWLGAALEATNLTFGIVNAPGQRYHPAIVAQAAATLTQMYPERFWVALGSGENLNEHITGDVWPPKQVRNARLRECVDVMRALFAGETVTHDGLVRVHEAKLYTRPDKPPPLYGAAVTKETARWVGSWADGLITVNQPREKLRAVLDAFHEGGGAGKPSFLQVHVSYARTEEEALAEAHQQWRANAFSGSLMWDVPFPTELDAAAKFVRPDDVREAVRVCSDLSQQLAWLEEDLAMGFARVYVHQVARQQELWIGSLAARW